MARNGKELIHGTTDIYILVRQLTRSATRSMKLRGLFLVPHLVNLVHWSQGHE